ncbi:MAG: carbonic anhydrase [Oscillatoriales cyanobacterium RM2_1_1]|nr:carbonic anhydrase [Oscillatoriales cyanobacterium SM2_3_0]NJO46742.1 carbonic anhydrase [Oscillatoriales cyanobacterium RM2_1_1]
MPGQSRKRSISRRSILKGGAGVGTAVVGWLGSRAFIPKLQPGNLAVAAEPADDNTNLTPAQALQKLIDGNNRFVEYRRQNPNQTTARLREVAQGQKPFAAILSCADSRVPVELIFDQGLGDIFVVRVAGNIATREDIASHEFGTLVLGAKVLMVIGHSRCGAVEAAIKGGEFPGAIGSLVEAIQPAVDRSKGQSGNQLDNAIKANVELQAKRLLVSPVISELVETVKLKVVGGYYDLDTGRISVIS